MDSGRISKGAELSTAAVGALLTENPVPQNATGAPMNYLASGKQYIVCPAGSAILTEEWIALALP